VAIIRGEWDGLINDEDARWLFDAFTASPIKRDIKISRGTHLMHLETMRYALYRESIAFLMADDELSVPRPRANRSQPTLQQREGPFMNAQQEHKNISGATSGDLGRTSMKREVIHVEPLSTYLENSPTSAVTRSGDTIYVSGFPPFDPDAVIYARYFPKDPPARIFVCVPAWPGPFDIEVDCIAVRKDPSE
jgi:enamine deaminase RidA (YjgF/YER057c/UK114 family)